MQEKEVRELLLSKGIDFARHGTIMGTLRPSVAAYEMGMGPFMNTMREHVLHLNSSGLAVIPIDDRNGRMSTESLVFIGNESIEELRIRMRLLHLELAVCTPKGEIVYRIRKSVIGAPWHKENLAVQLLRATEGGTS